MSDPILFSYQTDAAYSAVITVDYNLKHGIGVEISDEYDDQPKALFLPPDQARQMATAILAALDEQEGGE